MSKIALANSPQTTTLNSLELESLHSERTAETMNMGDHFVVTRTPPGRTYSEHCTSLFGTEEGDDGEPPSRHSAASPSSVRSSSASSSLSLYNAEPDENITGNRRASSFRLDLTDSHPSPQSSGWWKVVPLLMVLTFIAYAAGSHYMTRDLRMELQRQLDAQEALKSEEKRLLQEAKRLQELDHHHRHLQSTLNTLSGELQRKKMTLHREIEKSAQIEHEVQQMKTSLSTGSGLLSGMDGTVSSTVPDEFVAKMVQTLGYEQFGLRPHRLEIHLSYRHDDHPAEDHYLLVELSMLHMPVTVFTFLNQVEHRLYDHVQMRIESGSHVDEHDQHVDESSALTLLSTFSDPQWKERELLGLARVPTTGERLIPHDEDEGDSHPYGLALDEEGTLIVGTKTNLADDFGSSWFATITRGTTVLEDALHAAPDSIEIISINLLSNGEHEHLDEGDHVDEQHDAHQTHDVHGDSVGSDEH